MSAYMCPQLSLGSDGYRARLTSVGFPDRLGWTQPHLTAWEAACELETMLRDPYGETERECEIWESFVALARAIDKKEPRVCIAI